MPSLVGSEMCIRDRFGRETPVELDLLQVEKVH